MSKIYSHASVAAATVAPIRVPAGSEIAMLERNFGDALVIAEIEEFLEDIEDHQPRS